MALRSVVLMSYVMPAVSGKEDVTQKVIRRETLGRQPGVSNSSRSAAKVRQPDKYADMHTAFFVRGYSAG